MSIFREKDYVALGLKNKDKFANNPGEWDKGESSVVKKKMLVTLAFIQTINIPMATSQGSSSAATVFVLCKLVTIVLCYWTEAKEKESVQKSILNGESLH